MTKGKRLKSICDIVCLQVVFSEYGWAQTGHNIAVDLTISSDRKEVTCSVGGDCGLCAPEDGKIFLDVEGKKWCISSRPNEAKTDLHRIEN